MSRDSRKRPAETPIPATPRAQPPPPNQQPQQPQQQQPQPQPQQPQPQSLQPNQATPDDLQRVGYLAIRNLRNRYFLASEQNTFGGFQVANVLVDSGCSSLLLPLVNEASLANVTELFRGDEYIWTITRGRTVMTDSLSLRIDREDRALIPLVLCQDLNLGHAHPGVPHLRFFLCPDDARALSESPILLERNVVGIHEVTPEYLGLPNVRRRTNALLGQECLGNFHSAQQGPLGFGMESVASYPANPVSFIHRLTQTVVRIPAQQLPGHEGFNALEDDLEDIYLWFEDED